jgi:hypothetical protein
MKLKMTKPAKTSKLAGGSMRKKKMHIHKWILDKNNFGKCKCGASKQFPVEEPKGRTKLAMPPKYDPSAWLSAKVHGIKIIES